MRNRIRRAQTEWRNPLRRRSSHRVQIAGDRHELVHRRHQYLELGMMDIDAIGLLLENNDDATTPRIVNLRDVRRINPALP